MSATAMKLTEAQMLSGLKGFARGLGFNVYHALYSPGSDKGWPDLMIVGYGVTYFLELKGPKGRVSPYQEQWINALCESGHDARIIWPQDFDAMLDELQIVYRGRAL